MNKIKGNIKYYFHKNNIKIKKLSKDQRVLYRLLRNYGNDKPSILSDEEIDEVMDLIIEEKEFLKRWTFNEISNN